MEIKLPPDHLKRLKQSLHRYVESELDLDMGDLKTELFLEFLLHEIGAYSYNQAIRDAQAQLQTDIADLDGSLFLPEGSYWDPNP